MTVAKRVRLAMIGGGSGAFIGEVHRIAARMDNRFELVAGVFNADPVRGRASAAAIGIDQGRVYENEMAMFAAEARRDDGAEAVVIVTPNHLHGAAAMAALDAGFHVICEKPMTATFAEAEALAAHVRRSGKIFVLTHTYTGYPMIRQARAMVAAGEIGTLRRVQAEYAQDWLAEPLEHRGVPGAVWRTDPAKAGLGGAIGDIGTHAFNLAGFVTGEQPTHLLADLTSFVAGRRLDDDAGILLRYASGAKGSIWVSQIAVGNGNNLSLRVYGTRGGLEWRQEAPEELWFTPLGAPKQLLRRNGAGVVDAARATSRVPSGHPEGYLEAFANLYREAADAILAARTGSFDLRALPNAEDGLRGLALITACLRSSEDGCWVAI
ncbi:MAG TPA: Gfo/Idh/MocA family oxidoreductase [Acidocella sp.]|uniref:Gfo/Idh/MocA family protein n=1 Tax=Acidocella sp. TaxID=50710 RepID=UPI002C656873|nr:Gfo/Idh/MocA family oxidoreductase [Acidocella sp.]HVE22297.1 Gfo/Idh/MocA family oxidoreductase [Acidocella sp.]